MNFFFHSVRIRGMTNSGRDKTNDNTEILPAVETEKDFLPENAVSNPRQIRKIVGSFIDPAIMDRSDANITEIELETFLKDLARRQVTDRGDVENEFQQLISRIRGNILKIKCQPMFEEIQKDRRLLGILAYFTRGSIYRHQEVRDIHVLEFLIKYPNAYLFQYAAQDFLDKIEYSNTPEKRKLYQEAVHTFMNILYGKQLEYLIQLNLIKREAKQRYFKILNRNRLELETLSVSAVTSEISGRVMSLSRVCGGPVKERELTPGILRENGLEPRFAMGFQGKVNVYFSTIFDIGRGRTAVLGYMRDSEKGEWLDTHTVRSYYFSNSHGVWRYLDGYTLVGNRLLSYGKGTTRNRTTLPLYFQKALALVREQSTLSNQPPDHELAFLGTSVNAFELGEAGTQSTQKDPNSERLNGNFYSQPGQRTPPESIRFYDRNQTPDFEKKLTSWNGKNETYGKITFEAYLSVNDRFVFTFCRDERGRNWIGAVENLSPITAAGLRQTWVDGGDLITPAYEYIAKSDVYGNEEMTSGYYIDMFKYYLSKIWSHD